MYQNRNLLYKCVHAGLATSALAGMALSGQAFAQDEPAELERVETTGSRLSQVDIEGAQPVTVIDRDDIERIGLADLADVIRQLPAITGSPLSTRTNNGGNGASFVDIRGFGAVRTLVLINGKRDITDGDFSNIPIALVERIEVLKEGAAAIYGADAVTGVVNIITRRDFDGAELQAQYGASMELSPNPAQSINPAFAGTDADNKRLSFVFGSRGDRGGFMAGVEYNEQDAAYQGNINSTQFRNVVNVANPADFIAAGGFPACLSTGACADNGGSSATLGGRYVPADGSGVFTTDLGTREIRPFDASTDLYNFAPVNFIQQPFERTSFFFQGDYDLFDNVNAYMEARYVNRQSTQELAPNPLFIIQNILDPAVPLDNDPALPLPGQFGVPSNNAFNPFGAPVTDLRRRVAESRRIFTQEENLYQINTGLRGNFGDFAPSWTWDVSYNFGREQETNTDFGQLVGANFLQAIGPSFFDGNGNAVCGTPDAPIGGCVPLNLFGGLGTITQEMLDFVSVELNDVLTSQLQVANATFAGDIIDLPGGPLSAAFGYEFRKEEFTALPDSSKALDAVTGNTFSKTEGQFDVDSLFAEVNIPLLSGVPGAELLEIGAGIRYDDFSTIGDTTNFMANMRWQPLEGVLIRGSYAEVFREPTITELFSPQGDSFPSFLDNCRSSASVVGASDPNDPANNSFAGLTPEQQQNCIASGVMVTGQTAGGLPITFDQTNAQPRARVGGNPNLRAENGDTWTVGIAIAPEFMPGFSFTADYWNVDLSDAIATVQAGTVLNSECILFGNGCGQIVRQPNGEVASITSTATNIGSEKASGIDFAFNYNVNTGFGLFDTRLLVTWLEERVSTVTTAAGPQDAAGFFVTDLNGFPDGIFPEWKGQWTVDWSYGNFGASTNLEYLDSVREFDNGNPVESEMYFDVTARYNLPWGTTIAGGITNVFDNDPPFIIGGFNANTDTDTYRLLGRSWFARVTHRF